MQRLVYLTYMLMIGSTGVTFVFLEDFESEFGLPAWGIGLIASLGFFTAVISSVAISPLGDRGYIKSLGFLGFAATIVGNLLFAFSSDLLTLSLSRALTGIGVGLFSIVGRKALIGEVTDDSGEKIGLFLSAAVAGFIAGPIFGSLLSEFGGIPTPYFVIAGLLALVAIPTMNWLSAAPIAVSQGAATGSMLSLLTVPGARAAVAAQVAVFFNIGVFDSTVDEYLTDLGVSNTGVGIIIGVIALPLLVVPKLAGQRVDHHPRPATIMLTALALFVPIILAIGLFAGLVVFVSLAFVQTFVESTLFPAGARVVLNETGPEQSASGTGLLDASGSFAGGVSALIAPVLYDLTDGPLGPFGMSGIFAALMLVVGWASIRQRDVGADISYQDAKR